MSNASYVQPCQVQNEYNYCSEESKIDKLPKQTFSAINFKTGVGSEGDTNLNKISNIHTIVYDLNLLTLNKNEMFNQIDLLKKQVGTANNALKYMELGNEFYITKDYGWKFPNSTAYMETALPLINYIRQELPSDTQIAAVTQRALPGTHNAFNTGIAKYKTQFDAVTVHDYSCGLSAVNGLSTNNTASFVSIYGQSVIPQYKEYVQQTFGNDKKIWMTEFNMGLNNNGFPDSIEFSALHAMFAWSYITKAVCLSDTIEILFLHLISSQQGTNWGNNQCLMTNSADADDINGATFDIMGQVYSHINYVSMIKNNKMFCLSGNINSNSCPVLNLEVAKKNKLPCVHGTGFTNKDNVNSFGFVLINSCSFEIDIDYQFSVMTILNKNVDLNYWIYNWNDYSKAAKFTDCNNGQQLWECGQITPKQHTINGVNANMKYVTVKLPPLTLTVGTTD
eukprot:184358_1